MGPGEAWVRGRRGSGACPGRTSSQNSRGNAMPGPIQNMPESEMYPAARERPPAPRSGSSGIRERVEPASSKVAWRSHAGHVADPASSRTSRQSGVAAQLSQPAWPR
ncbi:hypothetical protein PSMK_07810 [Phycisphaera mikurensis NBRC 102666]|uniref:Uncharacterized protein n=1 Tax=Phycisphaera mikurensis (strain NBRC 102666 / KCTC 22515 / FYK2301M01) TaxID=1142394 RepID=I0ICF2_PHYMF|nr:hypothetical protein PSMK_07810 [Phycisphaera mikurensis NBRC 102666]